MEGFLRYEFGGLIFGGAYFRNFTVTKVFIIDLFYSKIIKDFFKDQTLASGIFKALKQTAIIHRFWWRERILIYSYQLLHSCKDGPKEGVLGCRSLGTPHPQFSTVKVAL